MNDKEYLDHVHKEGVELLQELKRACSVWNSPYTIIGGTMIGAIRDKGFIPWDNDIDVVMTRENYLQFLKIPDSFFSSGIHINCLQKIKKKFLFAPEGMINQL
jgi:lipopolysaccharide cholinephosphotransferase